MFKKKSTKDGGKTFFVKSGKMIGGKNVKAWTVRDKEKYNATVIFAETSEKAKSLAFELGYFEDIDFRRIQVIRSPEMDKYYKDGKIEMNWLYQNDRTAMVKDANFTCEHIEMSECKTCQAKQFCNKF